jgi:hypothetical protein
MPPAQLLRAIRRDALERLVRERTCGWNLEMQMRAARAGLRILELPVCHCRRAGGTSKVAGSLRGTIKATWQLTATMVRIATDMGRSCWRRRSPREHAGVPMGGSEMRDTIGRCSTQPPRMHLMSPVQPTTILRAKA